VDDYQRLKKDFVSWLVGWLVGWFGVWGFGFGLVGLGWVGLQKEK
jgi:hypothetical protein